MTRKVLVVGDTRTSMAATLLAMAIQAEKSDTLEGAVAHAIEDEYYERLLDTPPPPPVANVCETRQQRRARERREAKGRRPVRT